MKKFLVILLLAVLLSGGGALYALHCFNLPAVSGEAEASVFEIKKGESLGSIAGRLEQEGFIRSGLYLKLLSRKNGTGNSFKTGQYEISPAMSTEEIHDLLVSGKGILVKVTVPEGVTLKKTAEILEQAGIVAAADFVRAAENRAVLEKYRIEGKNAEGFIFPDSYFFQKNVSPETVLETFLKNFFRKLEEKIPGYREMDSSELYGKVILASIVEREYRRAEEAPLIASVFANRLETGMQLASCATIEYIIAELQGKKHPEYITFEDLKIESPYNTYRNKGLPPGPIANPGIIALEAAFNPAESDYLYFLLKNRETGEHFFSRKFSEHSNARFLYLKK